MTFMRSKRKTKDFSRKYYEPFLFSYIMIIVLLYIYTMYTNRKFITHKWKNSL